MFHYLLSDEFESQKNLDADLILFVRRFKLIGLANKSTIPENLLDGSSAQIPVKTIAKQIKKSRNRFRLKRGFDAKKRKKTLVDDPEIIFQVQNYFELDENSSNGDRVRNVVKIDGIEAFNSFINLFMHDIFIIIGKNSSGVKTNKAKIFFLKSYPISIPNVF